MYRRLKMMNFLHRVTAINTPAQAQLRSLRCFSDRFPVLASRAAVISEEVLASQAGLDTLRRGGSAADAVLTMAACMQVLQPYTAGVGGDCFSLHYEALGKTVHCVDGSGKSPAGLTLELAQSRLGSGQSRSRVPSGLLATVPGAAKAWFHIAARYGSGKLTMAELFAPAVAYAQHGFPMDHMKRIAWKTILKRRLDIPGGQYFLQGGTEIPKLGQVFSNRPLAALLKRLSREGPRAVYEGSVAASLAEAVRRAGGVLSTSDLAEHLSSDEPLQVEPASSTYHGRVVHVPPLPTQGAVLLEALNILEGFHLRGLQHVPGELDHVVIEALRHAVADGLCHVACPSSSSSIELMVSKEHAALKRAQVDPHRRAESVFSGPYSSCGLPDTTFLAATDEAGNVCAFIGSNANYFGCAVVEEHGFAVHCRGAGFCLEAGHPNCFGPRKKPYHSVMPVMVTDASSHDWLCTTGTMGGYAQTSIVTQLLLNMMELDLDPQQAVAKARFLLGTYSSVHPE
ncbi:glutathione hydrolase-like YwrD proenzyme isoform X2 [Haemaphysalis longicornis]